jgi:hypothetical protein
MTDEIRKKHEAQKTIRTKLINDLPDPLLSVVEYPSVLTISDVDTLFRTLDSAEQSAVKCGTCSLNLSLAKACKALDEARDVLKKMVLWHGGIHGPDCPQDDTCNCEGKPINDRIEQILKGGGDDD